MKIKLCFVKWQTAVICVSTWLMILAWKNVNGYKIISKADVVSVKLMTSPSAGSTDSTLAHNNRHPAENYASKTMAKNIREESLNLVVSSGYNGGMVNKTKNNQIQNKFNFIRKHSRLKKAATEKMILNSNVKPKISKHRITTNLTDMELAEFRKFYVKINAKRQLELDAQVAYLCMMFIILVICFASWYTGICIIRKNSIMDVIDFESSQPLTTVKDVVLRKSRYLPMFENFYKKKKKVEELYSPLFQISIYDISS